MVTKFTNYQTQCSDPDSAPSSFEEKHEECGIIAIYSKTGKDVAPYMYRALVALQHRGQDAAGFAILAPNGKIEARRGIGLVERIFRPEDMEIKGRVGIGHTRYPTIGECNMCDVQPSVYGDIATSHNGHVANYPELKKELEAAGYKFTSTVDSESFAFLIHKNKDLETAVRHIFDRVEGAYSDAAIIKGKLAIFRDPHAIRPLIWGENEDFIAFASETVALDINNIPYRGEIHGGELVRIEESKLIRKQLVPEQPRHCMFEYVYFARPDSLINGKSVYSVRKELGMLLAKESPVKADVVVAVPDTSRTAASGFSEQSGIPNEEGLIKNRYIGRTFIMPSQDKRVQAVRLKLNPVREIIEGKRIVLVDDSIVRGTTLKQIVELVRGVGAKEVHVRITCPPVKAPCFYGVDMSTYKELIANKKSVDEIRAFTGADSLAYISLEGLKRAIGQPICTGCLTNEYHSDFVTKYAQRVKAREQ